MKVRLSRRGFVKQGLRATASAGLLALATRKAGIAEGSPAQERPIRLGGPIFTSSEDPEELALAHRKLGYSAAYCPKVSLNDSTRIQAIIKAFAKHDVVIAEVGRWVNLVDRDPEKRRANLALVTEGLALAEALGARCCVDIPGSYNEEVWYGPHPDNLSEKFFDAIVENARKIIDAVKPKRTTFSYETVGWSIPDSADAYLRLIKAIDRKAFAVHFDPCNLIMSPVRFYRSGDLLNEFFDKVGAWIVSCHAKDLVWEKGMQLHFREVRPGVGILDYNVFLKRLASLPHDAPLMLEHLPNAEEYDKGRVHLFDLGKKIGVSFKNVASKLSTISGKDPAMVFLK